MLKMSCGKLAEALVDGISVTSLYEDKFMENANSQGRWGKKMLHNAQFTYHRFTVVLRHLHQIKRNCSGVGGRDPRNTQIGSKIIFLGLTYK
jgi:hypothetical protein